MIVIRSKGLLARIDPSHGGEVADLIELRGGRQLLGRAPFATTPPMGGDLDEETWTRGYRGGWQLLAPNAGNSSEVDGVVHGFHGRASNDPWRVSRVNLCSCALAWRGHGLEIEREFRLGGPEIAVRTIIRALEAPRLAIFAEHISFGVELLDPACQISLPGGIVWEQSETTGPIEAPEGAAPWPAARLLDGRLEREDHLERDLVRSRFLALARIPAGPITVYNPASGLRLSLEWERELLPFMWIWHEIRATDWLWRQRAEILVFEAASVPHALGLDVARGAGQATLIEPGRPVVTRLRLRSVE